MLSKEQLEKRIAEIRKVAGELKWSSVEHSQIALSDAEALEELLQLREQRAELKALPPVAWTDAEELRFPYVMSDMWPKPLGLGSDIPLFTVAKPAALPRHIFSILVNELRDVPAFGCKRELIIGVLERHGIIADSVDN